MPQNLTDNSPLETERNNDPLDQASQAEERERVLARAALALPTRFAEQPDEDTDAHGVYHRYCLDCGQEIDSARIVHVPFTVRCVSCQEALEHRGKQFAGRFSRRGYRTAIEETDD